MVRTSCYCGADGHDNSSSDDQSVKTNERLREQDGPPLPTVFVPAPLQVRDFVDEGPDVQREHLLFPRDGGDPEEAEETFLPEEIGVQAPEARRHRDTYEGNLPCAMCRGISVEGRGHGERPALNQELVVGQACHHTLDELQMLSVIVLCRSHRWVARLTMA
jgi:hypothetical protein